MQEMEQVYSRQFLKLFVSFLFLIMVLFLCRVEDSIQPLEFWIVIHFVKLEKMKPNDFQVIIQSECIIFLI